MTNDIQHLFLCSFTIHLSSLVKSLFNSFAHFIRLLIFLLLGFQSSFFFLDCQSCQLFFKIYFIDYAIKVVSIFSPLYSPPSCTHPPPAFPQLSSCPWVVYKFFGFYISYTILTFPLSIFYLPFMLLIPCIFFPILSALPPH